MKRLIAFDENNNGSFIVFKEEAEEGMRELPESFDSSFSARYKLVDGVVADAYPEKSDDEIIALLQKAEADRAAALAAAKSTTPTPENSP